MTDKELLEAAAKAVNGGAWHPLTHDTPNGVWNPLADDGDALRLAVALRLDVKQWNSLAIASKAWNRHAEENTSTQCPFAATRRAIVRAAALVTAPAA